jgi:hypothetical protein
MKKKVRSANQQPSVGIIANWDAKAGNPSSTFQNPDDDDSMVRPGGFIRDEETDEVERGAISNLATKNKKMVSAVIIPFVTLILLYYVDKFGQSIGFKVYSTAQSFKEGSTWWCKEMDPIPSSSRKCCRVHRCSRPACQKKGWDFRKAVDWIECRRSPEPC